MSENYALDYSLHRLNPTLEGAQEQANRSGRNIQPPSSQIIIFLKKQYSCIGQIYFVVF